MSGRQTIETGKSIGITRNLSNLCKLQYLDTRKTNGLNDLQKRIETEIVTV